MTWRDELYKTVDDYLYDAGAKQPTIDKCAKELESFIEALLVKQKEEYEKDFIDRAQKVGLAMSKYALLLNKLGLNPKEGV